jgi:WD40 repeat protein/serine/threonine protein kinase
MNPLPDGSAPASASGISVDDSRVIRALQEYQAVLQAGRRPNRHEFEARYPEIAPALAECLDGLEFVHGAAPHLSQAEMDPPAAASPGASLQPESPLGDFRLVREIGRGGMGVVYEAVQLSLGRRVAVKVLPFAAALDPRQLQRFKNEAQAAAQLHHPHIVPVHGVGCERGVHFYAMHFIEGQTLAAVIEELRANAEGRSPNDERSPNTQAPMTKETPVGLRHSTLSILSSSGLRDSAFFRAVAQLGIQAAEALDYAHRQGIIHRDIKPANLLLEGRAGRVNPLVLWIADFGLAKLQGQGSLTMTGDVVGTLRYMSPEQALAKYAQVDERTDLYSLGATLYELLTLEPAFPGRDREELLRQIAFDEPRPLRRLNLAIPAELETVVLKAMAKSPEERYATAQELADDLRRFLEDKPIRARRPSLRQRAVKWGRRHKTVVRAALVILLLAMVALAVSTVFIWRANDGLKRALERERQNAYYQRIALAEREWSANNLNRMLQLLDECPPDLRGWEWHYLQRLRLKVLPPLRHDSAVFCAVFSPDGERIASASQDGKISIWDARSGRQLFQFRAHEQHARGVAYSPDGRLLATTSWDTTVKIWDLQTLGSDRNPSPLRVLTRRGMGYSVVFSPDGKRLASAGDRGTRPDGSGRQFAEVKIWDPISGQELCTLEGPERTMWSALTFSPDGRFLATGHHQAEAGEGIVGNVVHLWDVNTARKIHTFVGHTQPVQSVAFSSDGRFLASGTGKPSDAVGTDAELKVWDVKSGRELLDRRGHLTVFALAFSPDGRRLASAGEDQTIKLWDTATGNEVVTLRGHSGTVRTLAFSADGRQLLSASHDRTVRVWDATPLNGNTDSADHTLRGHQGDVASVAYSPDGRYLVSAGRDRSVRVWDAQTGEERNTLVGHTGVVLSIAFSPDGQWLATSGHKDPSVTIWDAKTWVVSRAFPQRSNPFNHRVAFSPDGKLLAAASVSPAGGSETVVLIWDMSTGQEIRRLHGHTWNVAGVAFDRTGHFLAASGGDSAVHIYDPYSGQKTVTLQPAHEGAATSVAFSPDGKHLASGSDDRAVKIWRTRTWQLVRTIPDAHGGITSVAFAPDSRRLAWGGTDATVKVADVTTGQILETLHGHVGWVNGVAFSPDGRQIASASADGTVKIWQAPPVAEPPSQEARHQDP